MASPSLSRRTLGAVLEAQRRAFFASATVTGMALADLAARDRENAALRVYVEADAHQARSQRPDDRHAARSRYLRLWGDRIVIGAERNPTPTSGGSDGR